MMRRCCRGLAAVGLAAGLCLPVSAQQSTAPGGRPFTQAEHLMHHIIASHYGLTHQQVMDLHARGYSYEDIATAANIASRSGRPLSDVVALRDRPMDWPAVASEYRVVVTEIYVPRERVAGARTTMPGEMMAGRSSYAMPKTDIDWSRRYELTPLEMKRLRAMGLRDREIWVVANAAMATGRPVDEIAQHIFRGRTVEQIAEEFNLDPTWLRKPRPEWETPEWEQAVREGHWSPPSTGVRTSGQTPGTTTR